MTPQLEKFTETLHRAGVSYWLDFGTLLGFVRNGQIIKKKSGVDDIDIGILAEDEEKLRALVPAFVKLGYEVCPISIFGKTLLYKLFPEVLADGSVAIDIGIYRRRPDGKTAFLLPNSVIDRGLPPLRRFAARVRNAVYLRAYRVLRSGSLYKWPLRLPESLFWRHAFAYKAAILPLDLILPIRRDERTGLNLPHRPEEYLRAKYGDWTVPRERWDFWTDELDLIPYSFSDLRSLLNSGEPPQIDKPHVNHLSQ